MAKQRRVGNLLALAVLSTVAYRPMHPYEMGQALRGWGKDQDMPIKWGSLYTVVRNLEKHGLLEAAESTRQGARPERTVYRITDEGRTELVDWARELVSTPEAEPGRFKAGLSVLVVLPPAEAAELLRSRIDRLDADIASQREALAGHAGTVPALFLVEDEFALAMREAEVSWVRALLDQLDSGRYPGIAEWRAWHETGELPEAVTELAEGTFTTADPTD
ncbi:PadR family transcriptional regulator [Pseudonocardia humida]|uniref:PadR family transcriptional regulator n=1 Tax=Pseudonocardia humida TaxID=2800819 RepID=A0ABT1ACZ4_9PSEU|nr:PadR family transcriptional regulator [Pseudonocardia humida]MCO1660484.1 PadR family transcriptional regulator [Pseudonocardia humida]